MLQLLNYQTPSASHRLKPCTRMHLTVFSLHPTCVEAV